MDSDPVRIFSKDELGRCIWRREQIGGRTVESHVCGLRSRLVGAGAGTVLVNGWSLTRPQYQPRTPGSSRSAAQAAGRDPGGP